MLKKLLIKVQNQFFYTFGMLIFVLFFIMTLWGDNGILKLVELKRIRAGIAGENDEILRQNLLYAQEIERLKESGYVEQKARTDLGFVKENETVFVIPRRDE